MNTARLKCFSSCYGLGLSTQYMENRIVHRLNGHWPFFPYGEEDVALMVDYALDPSLDMHQARIKGKDIVIDQNTGGDKIVGTAVRWCPEDLSLSIGVSDISIGMSDWEIHCDSRIFSLRVRL